MSALARASGQTPTASISEPSRMPVKRAACKRFRMCSLSAHERHTVTVLSSRGLAAIQSRFDFEMSREEGRVGVHKQRA
jgi:hypothetical protein